MIQIYDTTLRDGTQRAGISLSAADKIRVARRLDELGFAFIEGGWPGSNPKDAEFFDRARDIPWRTSVIAAFGATCRALGSPESDANIQALLQARTPVCTVVGIVCDEQDRPPVTQHLTSGDRDIAVRELAHHHERTQRRCRRIECARIPWTSDGVVSLAVGRRRWSTSGLISDSADHATRLQEVTAGLAAAATTW